MSSSCVKNWLGAVFSPAAELQFVLVVGLLILAVAKIGSMKKNIQFQRRDFLKFMGRNMAVSSLGAAFIQKAFTKTKGINSDAVQDRIPFLKATDENEIRLAEGLRYQIILSWKDKLSTNAFFGYNNDYTAYIPLDEKNKSEGILWVNHESTPPLMVSGYDIKSGKKKSKEQARIEQENIGGSLVHIKEENGQWKPVVGSKYNRRMTARTEIQLISEKPIQGKMMALGTFANCAGGVTPWKNILTCEENYQDYYGEVHFEKKSDGGWNRIHSISKDDSSWNDHDDCPPEHYGWVVEINPKTGDSKKLTALGRFAHEGATCVLAKDKRVVVYMGDDAENQYVYKFISEKPGSLEKGTLYVAQLETGKWIPLNRDNQVLKENFADQTELLIRTREAAKMVGATPLDRPEDCEVDPKNNSILISLTMNKSAGRPFGSLLKIKEKNSDFLATEFSSETFLSGGPEAGFICPDNLCFDPKGNLWMTNDISDKDLNTGTYKEHGNNSLFYIPMSGKEAGKVFRVASAPTGAEFTGPSFSADGKTLFLSVQHPRKDWPQMGPGLPSVVAIKGDLIGS